MSKFPVWILICLHVSSRVFQFLFLIKTLQIEKRLLLQLYIFMPKRIYGKDHFHTITQRCSVKALSKRAIFMWQVLFICKWTPRLYEQFLFENKTLETGIYGWHQKICQFYVLSRLHGQFPVCDNFYLPLKNQHASFSANIIVIQKLVNFVHLHEEIKMVT